MSSVSEMFDELEWPSLEAQRDQSSLLLCHKIHCGAVSIEKDKYEGCPSKLWTYAIKRDCLSGIL